MISNVCAASPMLASNTKPKKARFGSFLVMGAVRAPMTYVNKSCASETWMADHLLRLVRECPTSSEFLWIWLTSRFDSALPASQP